MNERTDMHAIIITDGIAPEYPPELYESHSRAWLEAERWAWTLSGTGWLEVERPFDGRWTVGDRDVRLVPLSVSPEGRATVWIAQYWTEDGLPDPEAVALGGHGEALAWVLEPPPGAGPAVGRVDMPWFVSGTYRFGDEEAYAVASLAKFIVG